MKPDRWSEIERLFQQALEVPPDEREKFLHLACPGDETLRREVRSLLACDEPDAPLLNNSVLPVTIDPAGVAPWIDMAGRRMGAYRLIRLLGRGGMGAVYLAVRDDHYRKEVAVKLLKRGMDTDFMLNRFRQERQILANLEHPFIARLLDGGATDDGLPYFVMEYVDGLPLTRYCADKNLRDRLRLFRLVCEAVQYAHQSLVVHRDLKPGNILITKEGVPKLLDFGIAKLVTTDSTVTQRELRMMTPDYASPEQAMGLPIGTATDIYALGALLYELLTGERAHRFTTDSPGEIERIVCHVEPEKPSLAARRNPGAMPFSRKLSGDLDNIILTAMRKEPQRRYASAAEFSEDIRRHLEGLPVMAQEDRWMYTAGKFIRRNKLGVVAASLVIASLVGGIVATTFQARRAEARFQLVRGMSKSILRDLNRMTQLPGTTALRASMLQTVVQYLDSLARDAALDPALDLDIADGYREAAGLAGHPFRPNLGQPASALDYYRKALEIYERHAQAVETRSRALAGMIESNIQAGDIELRTGKTALAALRLKKVAAIAADAASRDPAILSADAWTYVYFRLGDEASRRGLAEEALTHYRKALDICRNWAATDRGPNARGTLRGAYTKVADALRVSGDLSGARDNYLTALRTAEESVKQPDTTVYERSNLFGAHQALAEVLGNPDDLNLGDRTAALSHYRIAVGIAEELAAADRQDVRARSDLSGVYRGLGAILLDGNPAEAHEYYRKALGIAEDLSAADSLNLRYRRDVTLARLGIGGAAHKLGRREEALQNLTSALEQATRLVSALPDDVVLNGYVSRAHAGIGNVLLGRGDSSGALHHYREALASAERQLQHAPSNLYLQRDLADAWETLGRYYKSELKAEARSWFQKSLDMWQSWIARKVAASYAAQREKQAAALIASLRP